MLRSLFKRQLTKLTNKPVWNDHPDKHSIDDPNLKYFVSRYPDSTLPVNVKESKTVRRVRTIVGKIDGDPNALMAELINVLQTSEIRVNPVNSTIDIKGDYADDVRRFLYEKGF